MRDSMVMFGAVILTALARKLILSYGERHGKEGICQAIALTVMTVGLLCGMLFSSHRVYRVREAPVGTESQQQSTAENAQGRDGAVSGPTELVSCAAISLIMGLLTAALTVFNKANNTIYKKAKYSLSKPVITGKLIAAPPSIKLDHISQVYTPEAEQRHNSSGRLF